MFRFLHISQKKFQVKPVEVVIFFQIFKNYFNFHAYNNIYPIIQQMFNSYMPDIACGNFKNTGKYKE